MLSFIKEYDQYPEELTVNQAAIILDLTPQTVRRYIKKGRLEYYHLGQRYIIPKSAVREMIQASQSKPSTGYHQNKLIEGEKKS